MTSIATPATATAPWSTVAATVVGSSHERDGTPGQDVVGVQRLDDGHGVVVAVADGAGSATDGARGAAVAVTAALKAAAASALSGAPPIDAANVALDAARAAVEAEAGDGPIGELASTLAVAVVTPEEVGAAVIGDSAVVVLAGGDHVVITGDAGEYINETTFLTSGDWELARRARSVEGAVGGVAVFSDGLALLALDAATGAAHVPFFVPLFAFASQTETDDLDAQLAAFLASPRVRERTDDDVTLALVVPRADALG